MKTYLFCLVLFFGVSLRAQTHKTDVFFDKKVFEAKDGSLPYAILLPENFDPSKEYPLLLFLHGAGERGHDNELQLVHGSSLFTNQKFRSSYPAIVVFPQCDTGDYWSNVKKETPENGQIDFSFYRKGPPTPAMNLLEGLLKELSNTYRLDSKRYYVGGLSMGGMGTFELVKRNPKMFAAAFPICGGAAAKGMRRYKRPAWWVFHGAADPVVPYKFSLEMVKALEGKGAKVRFSLYEGVGHNSWDNAFAEQSLFPWLFAQSK